MSFTLHIDSTRRLAVMRAQGLLTAEELMRVSNALVAHHAFGQDLRQLVVLDITSTDLAFTDLVAYRNRRANAVHSRKVAMVALNDLAFGVARQYALSYQHDDQEIRAFRDVAAACAWLDVTADDTAAVEALPPIIA